jgi:hypothetical protein
MRGEGRAEGELDGEQDAREKDGGAVRGMLVTVGGAGMAEQAFGKGLRGFCGLRWACARGKSMFFMLKS